MSVISFCPLPFTYLSFGILACFKAYLVYSTAFFPEFVTMRKLSRYVETVLCLQLFCLPTTLVISFFTNRTLLKLEAGRSEQTSQYIECFQYEQSFIHLASFEHCFSFLSLLPGPRFVTSTTGHPERWKNMGSIGCG